MVPGVAASRIRGTVHRDFGAEARPPHFEPVAAAPGKLDDPILVYRLAAGRWGRVPFGNPAVEVLANRPGHHAGPVMRLGREFLVMREGLVALVLQRILDGKILLGLPVSGEGHAGTTAG